MGPRPPLAVSLLAVWMGTITINNHLWIHADCVDSESIKVLLLMMIIDYISL